MGNHVLEGREHEENSSEPGLLHVFDKTVMERLAFGLSGASSPVHKILQVIFCALFKHKGFFRPIVMVY